MGKTSIRGFFIQRASCIRNHANGKTEIPSYKPCPAPVRRRRISAICRKFFMTGKR